MDAEANRYSNVSAADSYRASLHTSVRQRIQKAKDDSGSKVKYCFAVFGILLSTTVCQIISLIFTVLPIAMIYFGAKNLSNCPICKFIPMFLMIQGIVTLVNQALHYMHSLKAYGMPESVNSRTQASRLLDTCIIIFFIVGSVYVYKIYEPNYNKSIGEYCDRTTYIFAFWAITVIYALAVIFILSVCCALLILRCLK